MGVGGGGVSAAQLEQGTAGDDVPDDEEIVAAVKAIDTETTAVQMLRKLEAMKQDVGAVREQSEREEQRRARRRSRIQGGSSSVAAAAAPNHG